MVHYKDGSFYTFSGTKSRFLNCDRFFLKVKVLGVLSPYFDVHKLELWLSLDIFLWHILLDTFIQFIGPNLFKIKELSWFLLHLL